MTNDINISPEAVEHLCAIHEGYEQHGTVATLRALSAALDQSQDLVDRWINTSSEQDQTIYELREALTKSQAEVTAAYERAADLVDDMRRDPQYSGEGCDPIIEAIRALATPDQSSENHGSLCSPLPIQADAGLLATAIKVGANWGAEDSRQGADDMSESITTLLDTARRIANTDLYPDRCRSVIADLANALQAASTDLTESREYAIALDSELADRSEKQAAFTAMASSMDTDFQELRSSIEALGAMPEGYCFCSKDRIGDDSKIHEPECRDLRAVLGDK